MKRNKKISVIVSVFNQEKYIGRCLRSLLSQKLSSELYEILVVNDASTDRTPYALELFCNPLNSIVKVLNNKKKLGLPASINKAIKFSKSDYFVRVDSDDWVSYEFLNTLFLFLERNSYMDAVACDYILTDEQEKPMDRVNCMKNPIACGIMFRKKQIEEIGLYDESFGLHEDKDLRFRFEKKFKIHRIELPLYRYRRHDSNITNNSESLEFFQKKLYQKHGNSIV